ncbi:hypothetical protein B7C42_00400 [Nocardia cerradoensis]|uniref:Uncharacterized protein n=1 Tax=Nocardia cerradoensis TaxID=85688 RepID=A0A231HEP4_9NOCA|nr:hypothetical protein [Nocardia cerradoensis]OXR47278.1 hypothetical protein B7C42_00400 [Nocardia cerradoensis]
MGADTTPSPGLLTSSLTEAQNGNLSVSFGDSIRVSADEFVYIERDCIAFKEEIRALQRLAQNISRREKWGLGEFTEGLESSKVLVGWFRGKAKIVDASKDTSNNVWDILEQHYQIVDQLQQLHHVIAQKYVETDQEFAAEYNALMANTPASPIGKVQIQPGVVPQSPAVGAP